MSTHSLDDRNLSAFYRGVGFSGRVGFGQKPAVLVIDLARAWIDRECPMAADLEAVVDATTAVLGAGRRAGLPIFFTTMAYDAALAEAGEVLRAKLPLTRWLVRGSRWVELDPRLERREHEPLIEKQRASAFYGTTLLSQLVARGCDGTIITGCSTSGCIRATAEASFDHGFRTIVVREAVGDRSPTAHEANLFDIDARYADVESLEATLDHLESITKALGSTG